MSTLLAALAPLATTHKLTFAPEYDDAGNVTVAVVYSLKDDKDGSSIKTLNLSGTIAEVDAALVAELPVAVGKLVAHAATLKDLDAQLAAEVEVKKAKVKPAAKKEEADDKEADDNAIPEPKAEPPKRGKNRETKIIKTPAPAIETHAHPTPVTTAPIPPGLVPAWKSSTAAIPAVSPAPAPTTASEPAADLGSLFGDT